MSLPESYWIDYWMLTRRGLIPTSDCCDCSNYWLSSDADKICDGRTKAGSFLPG